MKRNGIKHFYLIVLNTPRGNAEKAGYAPAFILSSIGYYCRTRTRRESVPTLTR